MFDSFRLSESLSGQSPDTKSGDGGFVIDWFPTETIFPTEAIHPMGSVADGGIVIDWFPTETISPSVPHFELLI